jgi:hypothetical protein
MHADANFSRRRTNATNLRMNVHDNSSNQSRDPDERRRGTMRPTGQDYVCGSTADRALHCLPAEPISLAMLRRRTVT